LGLTFVLSLSVVLYLFYIVVIVLLSSNTRQSVPSYFLRFTPTLSAEKHPSIKLEAALIHSTST
jgi:hypothetical protein